MMHHTTDWSPTLAGYAILLSLDPNINSALCEILGVNEPEFTAQQVNYIDKAIDIAIPPDAASG